jgi:branched-chain amino acid transport system ATP-binding protein
MQEIQVERAPLGVKDVAVSYGGNRVLAGVSLEARHGFLGLIGPNGAGKTTLLNVISGYVRVDAGEVYVGARKIGSLPPHRIARLGVSRTFQTPKLIKELTVLENVLLGIDGRIPLLRPLPRSVTAHVRDLVGQFGLPANHRASDLPLATMKLVEVARAIAANPVVMLLDEPAAGLSANEVEKLVAPLRELVRTSQLAVVIIEHDLELITQLCDRVAVLNFGKLIAEGAPREVLKAPEVVHAYLGAQLAAVR